MKKFGIIAAVEIDAVKRRYGNPSEKIQDGGFDIYHYEVNGNDIYVLHSGIGEISAAAATQLLISVYHADLILNFGVVGSLTKEMDDIRLCVVEKVVHYQIDTSEIDDCLPGQYLEEYPTIYMPATKELVDLAIKVEPSLVKATCASGDRFVAKAEDKAALHEQFGADICEMEAAGIIKTANRNHVPCLSIKMVSDSLHGGAEEYETAFDESSDKCLAVLDAIMKVL